MNKEILKVASVSMTMMFLAGCGVADVKQNEMPAVDTKKLSAEQALSDAKAGNKKAAAAGFDWNVTYKLIKKSQELLAAGKYDDSIEASKTVQAYAVIGLEQEKASKEAAPRYIK